MKNDYVHPHLAFSQWARHSPSAIALDSDGILTSYGELYSRATSLASRLKASGVKEGDRVVIVGCERLSFSTAVLATLFVGAAFVPLDPRFPLNRLESIVATVLPSMMLAITEGMELAHRVAERCPRNVPPVMNISDVRQENHEELDASTLAVPRAPSDLCCVFFTSGSTGAPKGISASLQSVQHFVEWEISELALGRGARFSQLVASSFDAVLRDIFTPLASLGTMCVPGDPTIVQDGDALGRWLEKAEVNVVHCVPSMLRRITDPRFARPLPCLRAVLVAGEVLAPSDATRFFDSFSNARLVNMYGPSETTMTKTFYSVQPSDGSRKTIPVGRGLAGTDVFVVDSAGREASPGMVGEIYIRPPFSPLGYYGRPDLNAASFIPSERAEDCGALVYRTGDFGRLQSDGNLEFLGRRDNQVKLGGVRIELEEIETVLRKHEDVADVAVRLWGEEQNQYICAHIVPRSPVSGPVLREFVAAQLPAIMVPARFVELAELPRTLTGKIDRRALTQPQSVKPEVSLPASCSIEATVASVFAEVLSLEHVNSDGHFALLGGTSLLAAMLVEKLRRTFRCHIPLRLLFEYPVVADLATQIHAVVKEQLELSPCSLHGA